MALLLQNTVSAVTTALRKNTSKLGTEIMKLEKQLRMLEKADARSYAPTLIIRFQVLTSGLVMSGSCWSLTTVWASTTWLPFLKKTGSGFYWPMNVIRADMTSLFDSRLTCDGLAGGCRSGVEGRLFTGHIPRRLRPPSGFARDAFRPVPADARCREMENVPATRCTEPKKVQLPLHDVPH